MPEARGRFNYADFRRKTGGGHPVGAWSPGEILPSLRVSSSVRRSSHQEAFCACDEQSRMILLRSVGLIRLDTVDQVLVGVLRGMRQAGMNGEDQSWPESPQFSSSFTYSGSS